MLEGKTTVSPRKSLYYYYQKNSLEAVRNDKWKLVLPHDFRSYDKMPGENGLPGEYATGTIGLALYDLRRDPGERYDVKEMHKDIVQELLVLAEEARSDLGDDLTNNIGHNRRPPGKVK